MPRWHGNSLKTKRYENNKLLRAVFKLLVSRLQRTGRSYVRRCSCTAYDLLAAQLKTCSFSLPPPVYAEILDLKSQHTCLAFKPDLAPSVQAAIFSSSRQKGRQCLLGKFSECPKLKWGGYSKGLIQICISLTSLQPSRLPRFGDAQISWGFSGEKSRGHSLDPDNASGWAFHCWYLPG